MYDFTLCTPTKVVFGNGAEEKLPALIKEFGGKKVLIHYGGGKALQGGLLTRVKWAVEAAGAEYVELGGVMPNPRLSLVKEGVELCRQNGVDFILAVGGGSVIDSAKAIGMGLKIKGDIWDIYEGKILPEESVPVGVVLTIAAAGSEMSMSSVITNDQTKIKRGRNVQASRPVFAVMCPSLTLSVPPFATACGCADIFMHTLERYLNDGESLALTDGIAEALMKTVISAAKILKAQPDDLTARANILWAGALSHNGLTGCGTDGGDWTTHSLGHELSALYDVAHGAALTAVWGSWARYVYKDALNRFHKFAVQAMGIRPSGTREELALKGIQAAEDFFRQLGLPTDINALGVNPTDEELRYMAKTCAQNCGGAKGTCRKLYEEDMYKIYRAATVK